MDQVARHSGMRGRLEEQWQAYFDTEGHSEGPFRTGRLMFVPDPAPRFYLRFFGLEYRQEGTYEGCAATTSGGPWNDRGEAEEVAAWLNRRSRLRVFFYVTTRSPLEP